MALILQANVGRIAGAFHCVLETAKERGTDLVIFQEPPTGRGEFAPSHTAFEILRPITRTGRPSRVAAARRIDSEWNFSEETRFTESETEGDVQVIRATRRDNKGVPFRIVNAYFQSVGRGGGPRPAERAQWDFLLEESSEIPCIVGGDFNAHSPVWNKRCLVRRNATFLEDLIRRFNLSILNDQSQTRFGGEGHSIIDLTLATPSAAVYCRDWTTLELDEGTGSDHTVIEWKWQDEAARSDGGWKFRGWALKKKLDEEKEAQKRGERVATLEDKWRALVGEEERPILTDTSDRDEVREEIDWIQGRLVQLLNKETKKITICARSKRWWNEDIRTCRRRVGAAERKRKKREEGWRQALRRAKKDLHDAIRKAKRKTWTDFLEAAAGKEVWSVLRYIGPPRSNCIPTISHGEERADSLEEKATMLRTISFPAPLPYQGTRGTPGPAGTAHTVIGTRLLDRIIGATQTNKAPGPGSVPPLAIRCLYEWEPERIVALVRAHIRLGFHPEHWKTARGITIPKPGKDDYSLAKAYRVISLLDCLGKVVEKVAAYLLSNQCERTGALNPGQYGSRPQRSAVDAVGLAMARTQQAWTQGKMVGALLMDVSAAFPSVARDCLIRRMRDLKLDEDLIQWTDSFMQDRWIIMSVNGHDSRRERCTTGLPQGSPVSPILFGIYISEVHEAVQSKVQDTAGISFVDDVTWFVTGSSVDAIRDRLEACARESILWGERNAVRFEESKTEALLLSKKRGIRAERGVQVGGKVVPFAKKATRWLGVWLDWTLGLRDSRKRVLERAKRADAAVQKMVGKYGVPPASARNLQQALIHGTLLYAAELTWKGTKKEEREIQVLTNRMGRASLGVRKTTPVGIITAESALPPARALMDHRQASFALRLLSRPANSGGQEEILTHRGSELTNRIRSRCGLRRGETAEPQVWEEFREMRAEVYVEKKEEALKTAKEWPETSQKDTIWTDGSRLEDKRVGAAVAFKGDGGWRQRKIYLGRNKEVFDAEIFAIGRALEVLNEREEEGREYTIFSDSQAALSRILHDRTGPGQALAIRAITTAREVTGRGNTLSLRWTPSHEGIEGNEQADRAAKEAAEERGERADPGYLSEASLSYLTRVTTENRTAATTEWIRRRSGQRRRYRPPRAGKMRKELGKTRKELASRFFQLLSGHAAVAEHLKRIGQWEDERCFWCGSGARQTRHHLFIVCRRWTPEIRKLWQGVRLETGWRGAPSIRRLFGDERNVKMILEFLEKTKVGKMPSRILLLGGPDLEEEELEGFSLQVLEEEPETEVSSSGEEDGPGPPT